MKKTGIIIQARTGSTRLPEKLIKEFYNKQSVLDILLKRIKNEAPNLPIIVATTTDQNDDKIIKVCEQNDILYFRGSEANVLDRFTQTAESYHLDHIIRICADNPFFDIKSTLDLVNSMEEETDYLSFSVQNGKPSITTHFGFWGEITTLSALKNVQKNTDSPLHFEHVTSHLYSNSDLYNIKLIPFPDSLSQRTDLRFTLDTLEDFKLYKLIYKEHIGESNQIDLNSLIRFIDNKKDYLEVMKSQIIQNSK